MEQMFGITGMELMEAPTGPMVDPATFTTYWFMLPIGIFIGITCVTFGIGGGALSTPLITLIFPLAGVPVLAPADAVLAALITNIAGSGSGVVGYAFRRLVNYRQAAFILCFALPCAAAGSYIKRMVPAAVLDCIFAGCIYLLTIYVFINRESAVPLSIKLDPALTFPGFCPSSSAPRLYAPPPRPKAFLPAMNTEESPLVTEQIPSLNSVDIKKIPTKKQPWTFAAFLYGMAMIGGFITGMISVGIGMAVGVVLRGHWRWRLPVSAGTGITCVFCTVIISALTDILHSGGFHSEGIGMIYRVIVWSMPGVIVGGQIGSFISTKLSPKVVTPIVMTIFLTVASLMLIIGILTFKGIKIPKA
jgi:uncharacterized membrane protein YfcA